MAESTLAISFSDLQTEAAEYLGYQTDSTLWGTARTAEITRIIKAGLRMFYYPPGNPAHQWSFLYPALQVNLVSGKQDYQMKDDFGGVWGPLTVRSSDQSYHSVKIVPESALRERRAVQSSSSGYPVFAAFRPLPLLDGAGYGQRWEMMVYPTPDGSYTLEGRYFVLANALTSTVTYPYGGAAHAETLRQAVLAAAEVEREDMEGVHSKRFYQLLEASISRDKQLMGPELIGFNNDRSDDMGWHDPRITNPSPITYLGVTYSE